MAGISAPVLAALITQIGIPELMSWLAGIHAQNRVVTEADALAKLGVDADTGNAQGEAFLANHR